MECFTQQSCMNERINCYGFVFILMMTVMIFSVRKMEAKYAFLVNMKWFLSLLVAINDILLDIGST